MTIREKISSGKYSYREISIQMINDQVENIFNETISSIPEKEEYLNSIDLISGILSNSDLSDADIVLCLKVATSTAIELYLNEM